jgi:pyruvate carboxylase subunit B
LPRASHQRLVAALAGTEYDTGLPPLIEEIRLTSRKCKEILQSSRLHRHRHPRADQPGPGGMISNLANQLKEQGARQVDAALRKPRVREDLGPPPDPTSQIVGTRPRRTQPARATSRSPTK